MSVSKLLSPALRFFQLLFSAIALALLIVLANGQVGGSIPASTGFCAFAAAFAILASIIGVIAIFIDRLPRIAIAIVDLVAVLVTLAGGIAFAYILRHANCLDPNTLWEHNLLNGGTIDYKGQKRYLCLGKDEADGPNQLKTRCGIAKAGDAFLFITCIVSSIAIVLSVITMRVSKGSAGSGRRAVF